MDGYIQVSLSDMIQEIGENKTKSILSNFVCPLNKDVEIFLKETACEFAKQQIAATRLIFTSYKKELVLIGYYTLSSKIMNVTKSSLSKTYQKRISKFGSYDADLKSYRIPAPLIAQLSKNYQNGYNELISGDELLKLACDRVQAVQREIGGKFTYLECEDKPKLISFYQSNGFMSFGKRMLEKCETSVLSGKYLIQMLKYLK